MTEKGTKRQLFDKINLGACYAIDADGIFVADPPPVFFCFFVSFFLTPSFPDHEEFSTFL